MSNPQINKEVWTNLRKKWVTLQHISKVEFTVLKDPEDASNELAIDVAQNINGEWVVQTVQFQSRQAYPVIGIEGLTFDQLVELAAHIVHSATVPITGEETYEDELHLVMKRISPETGEIYGHVILNTGEKIGIRSNYQHYYVLNEILEQKSQVMGKEYAEVRLHRNKGGSSKLYFQFVPV